MGETQPKTSADCLRFGSELEAYLEGEVRPFVLPHSQVCLACGDLLADLEGVRQAARTLPLEDPSPALWTEVRARLAAEGAFIAPGCRQFGDELEAHLEGEPRPFILAHAAACASCGNTLADLQFVRQAAMELTDEEPSPALWSRVRAQLQAEGVLPLAACLQFERELEPFLEGEAHPFIPAHARDCAACGELLADLQAIRQAAQELPRDAPSRALWANVRARLDAEGVFGSPVRGWRQIIAWRLVPHAAPLAVLAGLVFLGLALTIPSASLQRWGATGETASTPLTTQMASMMPVGDDGALVRVVSDLESSFRANESSMTPDLRATYEKSLVSLDGAIRECLESLRHEPRSALAHEYLLSAYTRKAEVLSSALEFEGR